MSTIKVFFVLACSLLTLSCVHGRPAVDPCFTPGGNCLAAVIAEIGTAKSEVLVQATSLSSKPVADALIKAKEAGVKVEIILDKGANTAHNNAVYFSALNGIPTYLDGRHSVADNNIIIIDNGEVIAGSFKFTKEEEERNAENVVMIQSAAVAGRYRENWEEHKEHSEVFKNGTPPAAGKKVNAEKKVIPRKKRKTN